MFNFYVVLAGHDKVTDANMATTSRRKIKAPSLQTKSTKNEGPFENMGFNGKTVWRFQTKKEQKQNSRPFKNTQRNTRPLNATIENDPCNREKINRRKIEKKIIQFKTVGSLQD